MNNNIADILTASITGEALDNPMERCPRCGIKAIERERRSDGGTFYTCAGSCAQEDGENLIWSTLKQWKYLSDAKAGVDSRITKGPVPWIWCDWNHKMRSSEPFCPTCFGPANQYGIPGVKE